MMPDDVTRTVDAPSSPDMTQTLTGDTATTSCQTLPKQFGRYNVGDEIARGGMGAVLRATDSILEREVAIKVLQGRFGPNSPAARRFAEEARITGQLQHPAIPPVHDFGNLPDGTPFLAMKLIKGETLDELLKRRTNPQHDRGRFIAAFEQIAQAIAYAHAHNVIHRDLKPANIMLGNFGEVQVMDWGLAKVLGGGVKVEEPETQPELTEIRSLRDDSGEGETQAGSVLGTPAYMPPEQAIGAVDQIGKPSDVFGLGAILAVILTGKPPFIAATSETTRQLAAQGKVAECYTRLADSGAEPELVTLCQRCLSPEPADRYPDAGAVASAVAQLRADADNRARQAEIETASIAVQAGEERKRQKLRTRLSTAIALVLLTGIGLSVWQALRARAAEVATAQQLEETQKAEEKARKARNRTNAVLDTMTSEVTGDSLVTQKTITPEQKKFLAEVLTHYQEIAAETPDDEAARSHTCDAAFRIGLIQYRLNLYDDSLKALRTASVLCQKLIEDFPDNLNYKHSLAYIHLDLGATLNNHFQNYPEAMIHHRKALAAFDNLSQKLPEMTQYRQSMASCWQNISVTQKLMNQFAEALEASQSQLAVLKKLCQDNPREVEYECKVAESLDNVSDILGDHLNEIPKAVEYRRKALEIYDKLILGSPDDTEILKNAAYSHAKVGQLQSNSLQEYSAAVIAFQKSIAIYDSILKLNPDSANIIMRKAECFHSIGVTQNRAQNYSDALQSHQKALELQERLAANNPMNADYQHAVAESLTRIGAVQTDHLGQHSEALIGHQKAFAIREKLMTQYPDKPEYRYECINSLQNIYVTFRNLKRYHEAKSSLEQAAKIGEKLVSDFPGNEDYQITHANSISSIGYSCMTLGRHHEAIAAYQQALACFEKLLVQFPLNPKFRLHVAEAHWHVSIAASAAGQESNAIDAVKKALVQYQSLMQDYPDDGDHRDNVVSCLGKISRLSLKLGNYPEAIRFRELALEIYKITAKSDPSNASYQVNFLECQLRVAWLKKDISNTVASAEQYQQLATKDPALNYSVACAWGLACGLTKDDPNDARSMRSRR